MSNKTFKEALLASTVIAGMSFVATPAFAQADQPQPAPAAPAQPAADQPADEGPAIVVTGTLIRNPNLLSSSPVAVVGQEEIQLRQNNTAEEILRDLPGAVPSIGNAVNNGNGGAAFADLRGLGSFRNLILLDGQRIVPSGAIGRVDLNNIPLALVERVDTLTGGAATTYGADAVSGVVNFITRRDFAGAEISASEQITELGDGNVFRVDATIGANFDDGRGNAVLSVGYQHADAVYQGARRFSQNTYTSTTGNSGGSGTTVPTRFSSPGNVQINPTTGALVTPVQNFNFNPYNIFQTPFQRFNIYGQAHYEVADNIEFYTRGMFSQNTVNTIVAPSGIFGVNLVMPLSNPFIPAAARAQFCANNDFDLVTPGVQTLTPAQCAAAATATSPSDPNFRTFIVGTGRRITESGPRESEYTTNMFDYRAGLRIGITNSINLDISGSYGKSELRQIQTGYILTSRARTALYTTSATSCNLGPAPAVANANPLLPPVATGGAGTTGCVPLNIFGAQGSITPQMINYLTASATNGQRTSLGQARALLSGDFGASAPWAEDPIGFALGGEFRRYTAAQFADILSSTAGELGGAGGAVLPYSGGYKVYEGYGELIAPLVQHRPGFENLTAEAGIRYSGYTIETGGGVSFNTTTWKAALTWEPMRGIRLRGNYQRAVRAPNIAELFTPPAVGLTALGTDPCRTTAAFPGPVTNANLRAVCILQGAPASSIGLITNPTAAQANVTGSGALYLRPEIADSYTVGAVLQPSFIPGLSLTVDYYHIVINRAISVPSSQDIVNGCFGDNNASGITAASVNNPLCLLFRRDPVTGKLSGDPATTGGVVAVASNSGRILTDGIDIGLNYRRDLGFAKLNLSFNGNWTHRALFQPITAGSVIPAGAPGAGGVLPASRIRECVGLYSPSCGSPGSAGPVTAGGSMQPEFSWLQRTTLTFGDVDVSLMWRHISHMDVEPGTKPQVFGFNSPNNTIRAGSLAGETVNFGHIPAYNWFDLATRFSLGDHMDMTITVQNLLNKLPPLTGSTIGSTSFNSGNTYPSTYDTLGRRYAVSVRLRF